MEAEWSRMQAPRQGLAGAVERLRRKLNVSSIASCILDQQFGDVLIMTYVDGLTDTIIRTDVIIGTQLAVRRRLDRSLNSMLRPGDKFKLITSPTERGHNEFTVLRISRK